MPMVASRPMISCSTVRPFDAAHAVFHLGRRRVLRHGHAGARRVQQAHRLVGQLARGNVAVRELDRGLDGLVEQLHAVVLLQHAGHAAQHQDRLHLVGLGHLHDLEAAGERRVFLDVLLVLGPGGGADGAQVAARQRRLEQVGRIAGAGRAARAHERVDLVDEKNDRRRRALHLVDHLAQALLELALHARAGLQEADVQREQLHVLQLRRHVAACEALRETFDHGGLADTGLAGQQRVVLAAAHEDVDDLADLFVAPGHRVHLALLGFLGEVDSELLQRIALAHGRGRHRARVFARRAAAHAGAVLRAHLRFGRGVAHLRKVVGQVLDLDLLELLGQVEERVAQALRLQHRDHDVAGAHLRLAELQRGVGPRAFDGVLDVRREVADRGGAARQAVERGRHVLRDHRHIQAVVLDHAVQVGVLRLQQLGEPVLQFHIRIATHLAEHRGAFDGLVGQRVELAEKGGATDFTHGVLRISVEDDSCRAI
jgi:hypothetical protein